MRLDRTQIAIRERSLLDVLDLALRLVSVSWLPLLSAVLPMLVALMIANEVIVGWMLVDLDDPGQVLRYLATQMLLISIEAPLATVPMIAYLGQAVFQEQPRPGAVVRSVMQSWWPLVICQVVLRGVAPALWLVWLVPRYGEYSAPEGWLIALAAYCAFLRAVRPFISEIILLERNPLSAHDKKTMTVRRRSAALHGPHTGDLLGRWIATAAISVALVFSIVTTIWCIKGTLFFQWSLGPWSLRLIIPGTMWLVATFMHVVRFLNYLDTRIRREGWEVELIVRAAAARLEGHFA